MDKVYYKCIECNHRFTADKNTAVCPKCNSEDIKEQTIVRGSQTNYGYIARLFSGDIND